MNRYTITKVNSSTGTAQKFESLPVHLYPEGSHRFKQGHDPVTLYLEGRYIIMDGDEIVGRFSFYENPLLTYQGQKTATIGSYECIDNQDASNYLLEQAKSIARQKKYQWLIGPMEGSTWNSYRFSDHNKHSNFFMEPYHHSYYNSQFVAAGFERVTHYLSNLDEQLQTEDADLDIMEERFNSQGAVFRSIDIDNYEDDLKKIGQLSIESFKENLLYTPITIDQFVSKYLGLKEYIDPGLISVIEDGSGEIQAFLFAIHDHFEVSQDTLIMKSVARKMDSPYKDVSRYLVGRLTQRAKEKGYKKVIHAMMIHNNHTVGGSAKYNGTDYKSYTLYGLRL